MKIPSLFRRNRITVACALVLTGCSAQNFFYYPNQKLYVDPERTGLPYEIVQYPSGTAKKPRKLTGLYFPVADHPKGIVIHFHGNFGNVSNHFPLALFLVRQGFEVLSFDYSGYGASEGKPSPKALLEDGRASVRFAESRAKQRPLPIFLFGQSLGGFTAIQVAAVEPEVKAVVIEAAFSGQRTMVRAVLKRHVWLWPLYPIAPLLLTTKYDALKAVAKITPRPILFIHGDADTIVPVAMSEVLYQEARDPKQLWIVPGANHLEVHRKVGTLYEKKIIDFIVGVSGS